MDESSVVSERVRLLIQQLLDEGRSQEAVGKLLGVSQAMVSKVRRREREPGGGMVETAIKKLRIQPAFFYGLMSSEPKYRDFVEAKAGERVRIFDSKLGEHSERARLDREALADDSGDVRERAIAEAISTYRLDDQERADLRTFAEVAAGYRGLPPSEIDNFARGLARRRLGKESADRAEAREAPLREGVTKLDG